MRSSCKSLSLTRKPEDPNNPWIGLHPVKNKPLSIYDKALQILKSEGILPKEPEKLFSPLLASIPCFMASSYDKDFPLMEPTSNPERNLFSRPFVQSTEVLLDGSLKQPSQPTSSSEETSSVEATSIPSKSHCLWETHASSSSDQFCPSNNLSDSNALADLSRVFMASQTDPQPSTQTVDTLESLDETTPIVEELPERHSPAPTPKPMNGPWFNLEDSAPHLWR
ncbi:hypothetical protein Ddye_031736 [Dipteronia dyeriana]|uniref:Uncharacterized protein n=1 Tax=Dipteronia dyeriana TaxID=168575 RepID=A0AAD9WMK3_9ROSI|nr:hypothetical protein Ddye_031736 [Dipteronia dyeriana]